MPAMQRSITPQQFLFFFLIVNVSNCVFKSSNQHLFLPLATACETNATTNINNMTHTTLFYEIILDGLLFREIKELLNNTYGGSNNLLSVSRKFQQLKKANLCFKLNRQYSITYYSSSSYRERITLLIDKKDQLSLNLESCSEVVDVTVLADVHNLKLHHCQNLINVSALGHVYDLDLSICHSLVDVSTLGGVHTLNLSFSNLVNVSALGHVYDLDLCWCDSIVDVNALGGVHTLNLSYCHNIVNVSALGHVYDLDLSYCCSVVDVSALGGVHILDITHCRSVVDITALGNVHTLIR
jgi:hypothetical protein